MLRHTRLLIVVLFLAAQVVPAYSVLSASEATFGRSQRPSEILQAPETDKPYVAGRLLVQFEAGTSEEEQADVHNRLGGQVVGEIESLGIQILEVPEEATSMVFAYQTESAVSFAEPDYIARIAGWPVGPVLRDDVVTSVGNRIARTPNDPHFSEQWALATARAQEAWDITVGSANVVIAVVDTGADASHSDLQGKLVAGYDFVNDDSDPTDDQGHGTHVAGTAAAATNNAIGVAGVAWECKIMPLKALSSSGDGNHSWIAKAVVWAADHNADVINMSLGGPYTSATLQQAIEYAWNRGVVIVAAAGNESYSNPTYPAAYGHTIGVSATTHNDQRASFSNYGDYIDVAAPGVSILSTTRNNGYQAWSGTSMATPNVAGQAALIKSLRSSWTNAQIRAAIEQTAHDLDTPGKDPIFGWGRMDLFASLSTGPVPTMTPTQPYATRTPTPVPTESGDPEQALIDLINEESRRAGLPALRRDERLMQAARRHSTDMATYAFCNHTGTDGSTPFTRISDAGYPYISASEIIACGWQTASDVLAAWKQSPPHWQILMDRNYHDDIGCGLHQVGSGARYWTCNLASTGDPTGTPEPTRTPTPTRPTPTPTVTRTPTPVRSATPAPTDPGEGATINITPAAGAVGWVVSNETGKNHWGDDDMYSGHHGGQVYYGAVQFDLSGIPRGARVNWARLTVVGQTRDYVGDSGSWSVDMLGSEIDTGWPAHDYLDIRDASAEHGLLPILRNEDLQRDRANVFNLDSNQASALEYRISGSRYASFRLEGPKEGADNLFSWDSGYGPGSLGKPPKLTINYTLGEGTTPTPSPTTRPTDAPGDVQTIVLTPEPGNAGWVSSYEHGINHWDDDDVYAGIYTANMYIGGIRFNLAPLPLGVEVVGAELELTGQTREYMQNSGTWRIEILESAMDAGWPWLDYGDMAIAAAVGTLQDLAEGDSTLEPDQLDVGRVNRLGFTGSQLTELSSRRGSSGYISLRASGPTTGNNVFAWDTGRGDGTLGAHPVLRITYRESAVTVTPGPTATPTQPTGDDRAARLIQALNAERQRWGFPPLTVNSELNRAAQVHSDDLATHDLWSHIGSDASSPADRMRRAGYPLAAGDEALAANTSDETAVLNAWLGSPRHQAMLLNVEYVDVGAAHAFNPSSTYGDYWTLLVARPIDNGGGTPGGDEVHITPAAQHAGFLVSNEPVSNHLGDDDMYAGTYYGLVYIGAMQFDLSSVPSNADITGATLNLTGQSGEFLSYGGTWAVHLLNPAVDAGWSSHGYAGLAGATSLSIIGSPMGPGDLRANSANVLTFSAAAVGHLRDRLASSQKASFRINGPESGGPNVFSWHSGVPDEYGNGIAPVLTVFHTLP